MSIKAKFTCSYCNKHFELIGRTSLWSSSDVGAFDLKNKYVDLYSGEEHVFCSKECMKKFKYKLINYKLTTTKKPDSTLEVYLKDNRGRVCIDTDKTFFELDNILQTIVTTVKKYNCYYSGSLFGSNMKEDDNGLYVRFVDILDLFKKK